MKEIQELYDEIDMIGLIFSSTLIGEREISVYFRGCVHFKSGTGYIKRGMTKKGMKRLEEYIKSLPHQEKEKGYQIKREVLEKKRQEAYTKLVIQAILQGTWDIKYLKENTDVLDDYIRVLEDMEVGIKNGTGEIRRICYEVKQSITWTVKGEEYKRVLKEKEREAENLLQEIYIAAPDITLDKKELLREITKVKRELRK